MKVKGDGELNGNLPMISVGRNISQQSYKKVFICFQKTKYNPLSVLVFLLHYIKNANEVNREV